MGLSITYIKINYNITIIKPMMVDVKVDFSSQSNRKRIESTYAHLSSVCNKIFFSTYSILVSVEYILKKIKVYQ